MKKLFLLLITLLIFGCQSSDMGQLIGVQGRPEFYQPDPYGMLFIPMGSYNMGPSDQDAPYAITAQSKTVSVQAFYMDETEITNNEYRQFVQWVLDSIAHNLLGESGNDAHFVTENQYGEELDPPYLNWDEEIDWESDEGREVLDELYYPEQERYYRRKELDKRKLMFKYYWIDLKAASAKSTRDLDLGSGIKSHKDRSLYIRTDIINVYPDTLCWIHDFTYSYNEPMANMYFWHPAYDNYPVVGVNWKQARAFCIWRTQYMNAFQDANEDPYVQDFRLPTESEWEWASRGGLDLSPYPWGGPYIRNSNGCFLANYKPLRGNYLDDGGFQTVVVAHYHPNDFGLYDMAGNVAEWTSNAFDESSYNFAHDLNMDYVYEAKDSEADVFKRKVIRGGSWKDIGYYIQNGTRTYEYQDTAKSYIGFRCVQTYLGRDKKDGPGASNIYN
ncbi:MAG: gliding motility-associated lipoprotein [Bacteroidetes bacterium GWE2_29_8]|nr:MAG: gliding motility-associated lipoprotein [Bacteroidetes bacterium GWE2_29_8]OFY21741.1 MAG: gliding motility-associated lipoprotein [Bacteroidetes bacterium GWF2_29_10]